MKINTMDGNVELSMAGGEVADFIYIYIYIFRFPGLFLFLFF